MRTIKVLEAYPPIYRIFDRFAEEEMAVFLDSSMQNELGQYSIIGLFPWMTLVNGDKFTVNGKECGQRFETYVKEYLENHREENPTHLPIVSGAVGYFSYDYGRKKEGVASRHGEDIRIPDCILCFYDVFLVEDHREHRLYVIANGKLGDSRKKAEELAEQIREVAERVDTGDEDPLANGMSGEGFSVRANFEKKEYLQAVDAVIRSITEGDIYIMNMTQQGLMRGSF